MTLSHPSFVGFDRIFDQMERMQAAGTRGINHFPPHNIIIKDDGYIILELAVSGYEEKDLTITQEKDTLCIQTVEGYVSPDQSRELRFAHKGISSKKFKKYFTIAENVEVLGASLENGILTVNLREIIPEEDKPKVIQINHTDEKSSPKFLTENGS